ncbi:unnamed protein product [Eruca vesicaria subsp. sativa]|uniref:Uncharacterized protein n=1 Tax=Eruca vesicaria subsp. sativa TaxID=29727 RepID=A0ABC8J224_ERUVS|nr:unnamed protein product [Eruca vesicaria subsp. sativa]
MWGRRRRRATSDRHRRLVYHGIRDVTSSSSTPVKQQPHQKGIVTGRITSPWIDPLRTSTSQQSKQTLGIVMTDLRNRLSAPPSSSRASAYN